MVESQCNNCTPDMLTKESQRNQKAKQAVCAIHRLHFGDDSEKDKLKRAKNAGKHVR